jgi:hypothetical protein
MQEPDLLKLFAAPLERANIEYVITGSIAMILYAEPRLTHDIDIVIHLNIQIWSRSCGIVWILILLKCKRPESG